MANNDFGYPLNPSSNDDDMPPGSAIMPQREAQFLDPTYAENTSPNNVVEGSIFRTVGLTRPNNPSLSNADQSQDYDFNLFNSYIHYMSNPAGGVGLIDQTTFDLRASVIYNRSATFQSYSPYV